MPIDEARRPRRIIEAAPAREVAASPLLRLADRFQRALLPRPERGSPGATRGDPDDEPPAAGAPGAPAPPPAAADRPARRSELAPAPAAAPRPAAVLRWQPGVLHEGDEPPASAALPDAADEPDDDGWQAELARWIAQLCNGADAGLEGWSVTLPMKARILPQTTLRLELSPHWLALRFHTGSARALSLLSRHRTSLEALLRESLKRELPIDIEIA